ncbi:hypothetical protein [Streptomyces sp. NPDC090029]|uniref:hypothetical protein n=1 Tax=Streptomyces sp. NPDC090029 TaxID=3365924 RepID=UPI00380CC2C2
MTHATIPHRPAHPGNECDHPRPVTADRAPQVLAAADAASAHADGLRHGDALVDAPDWSAVERVREGRL